MSSIFDPNTGRLIPLAQRLRGRGRERDRARAYADANADANARAVFEPAELPFQMRLSTPTYPPAASYVEVPSYYPPSSPPKYSPQPAYPHKNPFKRFKNYLKNKKSKRRQKLATRAAALQPPPPSYYSAEGGRKKTRAKTKRRQRRRTSKK